METNEKLIRYLQDEFAMQIKPEVSYDALISIISTYVNELIQNDFQKLINILYRLDVNENKLRYMLKMHNAEDAGNIIATLIVERELQKIKSREHFTRPHDDVDDAEKW